MSRFTKYVLFTYISAYFFQVVASRDLKTETTAGMMSFSQMLSFCMLMPALGAIFAGADIKHMGWRLNIGKNYKYILISWLAPTVFQIIGAALYFLVFPGDYDGTGAALKEMDAHAFEEFEKSGSSYGTYIAKEIFYSLTSFFNIPAIASGLGEEIGWRGYLYPELKNGYGRVKGALLGGVMHGAWHFPLMILVGYEYGKDYTGAPLLGMLAFCIFTTSTGIISFFLYERTHSIWLPAMFHGFQNSTINPYLLRTDDHYERTIFGPADIGLISVIPIVICAGAVLYFERKKDMELLDDEV